MSESLLDAFDRAQANEQIDKLDYNRFEKIDLPADDLRKIARFCRQWATFAARTVPLYRRQTNRLTYITLSDHLFLMAQFLEEEAGEINEIQEQTDDLRKQTDDQ